MNQPPMQGPISHPLFSIYHFQTCTRYFFYVQTFKIYSEISTKSTYFIDNLFVDITKQMYHNTDYIY